MDPPSLDQGWHLQFLTKFQKLDGFGLLAPVRVRSRYGAYACTEIFCTCRGGAHQYGAWRAGGGGFRPARAGGGVGGPGGVSRACPGAVLRARPESESQEGREALFRTKHGLHLLELPLKASLVASRALPRKTM